MVKNNNIGRKIRKYFIEVEKRYKAIVETPQNIFDVIYYKPKAEKEISEWFNKNKEEIEYKIIYERNTKNGKKGEIKERGFKIENVCYKVKNS